MFRPDEVEIVGGGMVLGKGSELASLQRTNGEVSPASNTGARRSRRGRSRGSPVPLTCAGGRASWRGRSRHRRDGSSCRSGRRRRQGRTRPDRADPRDPMLPVAREPGNGADRAGGEHEAVAVARLERRQALGQHRQQRQSRAVVVRERRMADVRGEEKFLLGVPRCRYSP